MFLNDGISYMYFEVIQTRLYLFNIGNNKGIGEFLKEIKNKEKKLGKRMMVSFIVFVDVNHVI